MRVNKANHADRADEANHALRAGSAGALSSGSTSFTAYGLEVIFEEINASQIKGDISALKSICHNGDHGNKALKGQINKLVTTSGQRSSALEKRLAALEEMLGIEWKEGGRYEGVEE